MQYPLLGDLKNRPVPADDGSNNLYCYDVRRLWYEIKRVYAGVRERMSNSIKQIIK